MESFRFQLDMFYGCCTCSYYVINIYYYVAMNVFRECLLHCTNFSHQVPALVCDCWWFGSGFQCQDAERGHSHFMFDHDKCHKRRKYYLYMHDIMMIMIILIVIIGICIYTSCRITRVSEPRSQILVREASRQKSRKQMPLSHHPIRACLGSCLSMFELYQCIALQHALMACFSRVFVLICDEAQMFICDDAQMFALWGPRMQLGKYSTVQRLAVCGPLCTYQFIKKYDYSILFNIIHMAHDCTCCVLLCIFLWHPQLWDLQANLDKSHGPTAAYDVKACQILQINGALSTVDDILIAGVDHKEHNQRNSVCASNTLRTKRSEEQLCRLTILTGVVWCSSVACSIFSRKSPMGWPQRGDAEAGMPGIPTAGGAGAASKASFTSCKLGAFLRHLKKLYKRN